MEAIQYKAGDVVFSEGNEAKYVFMVKTGTIEIVKQRYEKQVSLAKRGVGQVFGEMALIDDRVRSAGAIALTDVECLRISKEEFINNLSKLEPFMQEVIKTMAGTIRDMTETQILARKVLNSHS